LAQCWKQNEGKSSAYCGTGITLVMINAIMIPFISLLQLKLLNTDEFEWGIVFIPLWIIDGVCLCTSFFLLLFTIGAREDARFSLSQVLTFLCVIPAIIVFKVLLAFSLDGLSISYFLLMTPLLISELLFLACGLNIRFVQQRHTIDSIQV